MFGSYGAAPASLGVAFVSQASIENGLAKRAQIRRKLSSVKNARPLTKASFRHNQASPRVYVDPATLDVEIDGVPVDLPPAESLPLTQRYFV
jgi:urease alpha subunit